jgi:hypothetical protein
MNNKALNAAKCKTAKCDAAKCKAGEAVYPVIRGQVLFAHAEAVAAIGEHVQFNGFVRGAPFFV